MTPSISRSEIIAVEKVIRPYIRRTPVVELNGEDFGLGDIRLSLKLELAGGAVPERGGGGEAGAGGGQE